MAKDGQRARRKRSEFAGQPAELGTLLADLRTAKGLSLREVEVATERAVSNAYLSQLENGKIKKAVAQRAALPGGGLRRGASSLPDLLMSRGRPEATSPAREHRT